MDTTTNWITTTTTASSWDSGITTGNWSSGRAIWSTDIGIADVAPAIPWGMITPNYSYFDDNAIKVDKGSPIKARYAVFYAVDKDPVIFCQTRRDMIKEVKKLLKRKEVDVKSIRIFALIGGAKAIKKLKK